MSVLSMIGLVDAISYMAIAPSLIFYVLQLGGDKEMYGIIMSAFSLASFCGKPLYGIWVDRTGNKFRTPYIASFLLAIFGALLYFFGNAVTSPRTAVAMILVGRLFSGLGGANQALGFAYIALVVPHDQQTRTSTILSMTRIMGMALGPAVNLFLSKIHTTVTMFGFTMVIDSLNSVGLLLAGGNLFVMMCVILFLEEPIPKEKKLPEALMGMGASHAAGHKKSIWRAFLNIEIWLPILILLVVNSSFQLYVTCNAIQRNDWLPFFACDFFLGSEC
jgi:MFS family permease